MNTPNIKISNVDTFPNSYPAPGMESPNTMINPQAPIRSTDGVRVAGMPHGRTADDGQSRAPFADMTGEKIPLMEQPGQFADSDDLAPIVGGPVEGNERELAGENASNIKSNIPPGGREQGSSVQTSKMSQSFENGRTYKGATHKGNILKGDSNQIEITTYE